MGSGGSGRKDAIIHAVKVISMVWRGQGYAHDPGTARTEREKKAKTEQPDLAILATEEKAGKRFIE